MFKIVKENETNYSESYTNAMDDIIEKGKQIKEKQNKVIEDIESLNEYINNELYNLNYDYDNMTDEEREFVMISVDSWRGSSSKFEEEMNRKLDTSYVSYNK